VVLWIPAAFVPFSLTGLLPPRVKLSSFLQLRVHWVLPVLNPIPENRIQGPVARSLACLRSVNSPSKLLLSSVLWSLCSVLWNGLGSSPFARRYLGNRCFFLFLGVLRCFSSPGVPSYSYFIHCMIPEYYFR
jgi:hypothetical protein